jgi:hypothetical protein
VNWRGLLGYLDAAIEGTAGTGAAASEALAATTTFGTLCAAGAAPPVAAMGKSGTINKATMLMILMSGLTAGPAVSL